MKHVLRLTVILLISLAGELLAALVPLPVPAGIYGMVLLFACLALKIVPLEAVRGTGRFLTDIMPVLFIPAAVGLMDRWELMRSMLLPCLLAIVPVTLIVMAASGRLTQALLRREKRGEK